MAAHLVLQIPDGLARPVPAAADVAEDLLRDLAAAVALGKQLVQRLLRDLRHRIPHRDLDRADADRALGVAADLLALAHDGHDLLGIEIVARRIDQRLRIGAQDAWDEALAHLRAAGVAAGRVEREARDRLAVAHHVGDDPDHRGGHLGEIEARVLEIGLERDRPLTDVDDTHVVRGLASALGSVDHELEDPGGPLVGARIKWRVSP